MALSASDLNTLNLSNAFDAIERVASQNVSSLHLDRVKRIFTQNSVYKIAQAESTLVDRVRNNFGMEEENLRAAKVIELIREAFRINRQDNKPPPPSSEGSDQKDAKVKPSMPKEIYPNELIKFFDGLNLLTNPDDE